MSVPGEGCQSTSRSAQGWAGGDHGRSTAWVAPSRVRRATLAPLAPCLLMGSVSLCHCPSIMAMLHSTSIFKGLQAWLLCGICCLGSTSPLVAQWPHRLSRQALKDAYSINGCIYNCLSLSAGWKIASCVICLHYTDMSRVSRISAFRQCQHQGEDHFFCVVFVAPA